MTETDRIEATLSSIKWPPFVKDREWKVDVDSTGDKALWVWVIVSDPKDIEAASSAWTSLRQTIREALSAGGIGLWPYIRVKAESEREEQAKR
jgi:hypothetical protein